jgi:hypothetical protein
MLRMIGFAMAPQVLNIFTFLPIVDPIVALLGLLLSLRAGSIAVQTAHRFDTRRAIFTIAVTFVAAFLISSAVRAFLTQVGLWELLVAPFQRQRMGTGWRWEQRQERVAGLMLSASGLWLSAVGHESECRLVAFSATARLFCMPQLGVVGLLIERGWCRHFRRVGRAPVDAGVDGQVVDDGPGLTRFGTGEIDHYLVRAGCGRAEHHLVAIGDSVGHALVRPEHIVHGQPEREAWGAGAIGREVGKALAVDRYRHRAHVELAFRMVDRHRGALAQLGFVAAEKGRRLDGRALRSDQGHKR